MTLKKGCIYSTNFFKKTYGGNIQCSMPIVDGSVPYCKFDPKINLNFPNEAWIEQGPLRYKSAMLVAHQEKPIPVFKKIATNQWMYIGPAKFSIHTSNTYLNKLNINPPRNKIQLILKLNFF